MIEKTVTIGTKKVTLRASAAIPRIYRNTFGRDVLQDVALFSTGEQIQKEEVMENLAYVMAKHANPDIPDIDEWLEGLDDPSGIYNNSLAIMELWTANTKTTIPSKKKSGEPKEK